MMSIISFVYRTKANVKQESRAVARRTRDAAIMTDGNVSTANAAEKFWLTAHDPCNQRERTTWKLTSNEREIAYGRM